MVFYLTAVLLSAIVVATCFNTATGNVSLPVIKTESHKVHHITDEANLIVVEFTKLIQKHVDEIKKFRTLHPVIDDNQQLSAQFNEIIGHNIGQSISDRIKDIFGNNQERNPQTELQRVDKQASIKKETTPILENFRKLIETHVKEIDKFRSLHPNISNNAEILSKLNHILQDQIKNAANSRIRGKVEELIKIAKLSNPTNHNQVTNNQPLRISQLDANKANVKQLSHGASFSNSEKKKPIYRANDIYDEKSNEKIQVHLPIQHLKQDITSKLNNLKSTIEEKVKAKNAVIQSNLRKKFEILKKLVQHPGPTKNVNVESQQHNEPDKKNVANVNGVDATIRQSVVAETNYHIALQNNIKEKLGHIVTKLQSSKQAFDQSKAEFALLAQSLHPHSNDDAKSLHNHDQAPLDIQKLNALRTKLNEMALKRVQFIQDKILYQKSLNQIFHGQFVNNSSRPPLNINLAKDLQRLNPQSTHVYLPSSKGSISASENEAAADQDEIKLAAVGDNQNDEGDNDDTENSTVVVSVVFACLVVSAIAGVLIVVLWERYNRHRLYVRIPGGNSITSDVKFNQK